MFILWLSVFTVIVCNAGAQIPNCYPVKEPQCGFYTNSTLSPAGDAGGSIPIMFSLIEQLGCSQYMKLFLCSAMFPKCTLPPPMPCRSFCLQQRNKCGPSLKSSGIDWPFNCSMFDDSRTCVQAGNSKPDNGKGNDANNAKPTSGKMDVRVFHAPVRSKVRMVCALSGGRFEVQWMFNGTPLKKTKRLSMKGKTLKIKKLQLSDQGKYYCQDDEGHTPDVMFYLNVTDRKSMNPSKTNGNINKPSNRVDSSMNTIMSNLTSLWRYVKNVEKSFEGGVHLHTDGATMTKDGNNININLNVKDQKCEEDGDKEVNAHCMMAPNMPMSKTFMANHRVVGTVKFSQKNKKSPVRILVQLSGFDVRGLNPQHAHGFHIHTYGNMENGCELLGKHFNPDGVDHGAPDAAQRHHGDLGNIHCDNSGISRENLTDHMITMYGPNSIIGRSIAIHEGSDDMGLGGTAASRSGGNAGTKIACCIIGRSARP